MNHYNCHIILVHYIIHFYYKQLTAVLKYNKYSGNILSTFFYYLYVINSKFLPHYSILIFSFIIISVEEHVCEFLPIYYPWSVETINIMKSQILHCAVVGAGFSYGKRGDITEHRQDVVGVPWSLYRAVTAVRNRHAPAALLPSSQPLRLYSARQSFVDRRALLLFVDRRPPPRSFRAFLHVVYIIIIISVRLCVFVCNLYVCGALFFLILNQFGNNILLFGCYKRLTVFSHRRVDVLYAHV